MVTVSLLLNFIGQCPGRMRQVLWEEERGKWRRLWASSRPESSPLNQIVSSGPIDFVYIDFLSVEPDSKGISNVLLVTDHVTRYALAFPTWYQEAHTVMKIHVDKYFIHYSLTVRIHSAKAEILRVIWFKNARNCQLSPPRRPSAKEVFSTCL